MNLASGLKGDGWIDFQGSLFRTHFSVEGLEKRWDWLKLSNGKALSFVLGANGRARYYDFTFADEKGFATPRDTFECSKVQSNKLLTNRKDRDDFELVSPSSFVELGNVNYEVLNDMTSYVRAIKRDQTDKWYSFITFCNELDFYVMRRDFGSADDEKVHTTFVSKSELVAFLAHIDQSIELTVYASADEFLETVEINKENDALITSLITSIDRLPRGVLEKLNKDGGINYCQLARKLNITG